MDHATAHVHIHVPQTIVAYTVAIVNILPHMIPPYLKTLAGTNLMQRLLHLVITLKTGVPHGKKTESKKTHVHTRKIRQKITKKYQKLVQKYILTNRLNQ